MKKKILSCFLILSMFCSFCPVFSEEASREKVFPIRNAVPYFTEATEDAEISDLREHVESIASPPAWLLEEFEKNESGYVVEGIGVIPKEESGIMTVADTAADLRAQWDALFTAELGESFTARMKEQQNGIRTEGNSNRLVIEECDLSLPGKNGLDLILKRRFDNQDSGTLTQQLHTSTTSCTAFFTVYPFIDQNGTEVNIAFPTTDEYYRMAKGIHLSAYPYSTRTLSAKSGSVSAYDYAEIYQKETTEANASVHLTPKPSADAISATYQHDSAYTLDCRQTFLEQAILGAGWKLILPQVSLFTIERESSSGTLYRELDSSYVGLFRDIDGNLYGINGYDTYTRQRTSTSAEYTYTYTSQFDTDDNRYLECQYLWDMQTVPNTDMEYNFKLVDHRGLIYYLKTHSFSPTAQPSTTRRMLPVAVSDRYGNLIRYVSDSDGTLEKIIDTYGREIQVSETGISYIDESGEKREITYQTETLPADTLQNGSDLEAKEVLRFRVKNQEQEETVYDARRASTVVMACNISGSGGNLTDHLNICSDYSTTDESLYNLEQITNSLGTKWDISYRYLTLPYQNKLPRHTAYTVSEVSRSEDGTQKNRYSFTLTNSAANIKKQTEEDATGAVTTEEYDKNGLCTSKIISADGTYRTGDYREVTTYDTSFHPTRRTLDEYGTNRTETYSYNDRYPNQVESYDNGRLKINYTYHTRNGRSTNIPKTVSYTEKNAKTPLYTIETTLTEDGNAVEYSRTVQDGLIKAQTKYEYHADGRLAKSIVQLEDSDADGQLTEADATAVTTFSYIEENGGLVTQITQTGLHDADGTALPDAVTTYRQNLLGSILSQTDPNGNTTQISYDALQLPIRILYADGAEETRVYDRTEPSITVTDQRGLVQKLRYSKTGNLLSRSFEEDGTWITIEEYAYDAADRPIRAFSRRTSSDTTTEDYTYDLFGRLTSKEFSGYSTAGYTETYLYSGATTTTVTTSLDQSVKVADQIKTRDSYGRILSEKATDGEETIETSYTYDAFDRCVHITDPRDGWIDYTYDLFGNLLSTEDQNCGLTRHSYDMAGRKRQTTDPSGNTSEYFYDPIGRLILEQTPLSGQTVSKKKSYYDSASNLIKESQLTKTENGAETYRTVRYTYDNRNRLTATDGDTIPVSYTYDACGNMIKRAVGSDSETTTNTEVAQTTYTYDRHGRIKTETNPLGYTKSYAYDYAGNVVETVDANGQITSMSYGPFGQISVNAVSENGSTPSRYLSYQYNGVGQISQKREMVTGMFIGTDNETYTYDSFGRMTSRTNSDCTNESRGIYDHGYSIQYTYDKNSNLTGYTLIQNGIQAERASYRYDAVNLLCEATINGKVFTYRHDANGNLTKRTGNGADVEIAYNAANLPIHYDNSNEHYFRTYYPDGNVASEAKYRNHTDTTYTYTARGELESETTDGITTTYTYDSRGNRRTKQCEDKRWYYAYDLANQVRVVDGAERTQYQYSYDHAGNMLRESWVRFQVGDPVPEASGSVSYSYNEFYQLSGVDTNDRHWDYFYDVNGLRSVKKTGDQITTFAWNDGDMVSETTGTENALYFYDPLGIAMQTKNGQISYYAKNTHGDTSFLIDSNGSFGESYRNDPFGIPTQTPEITPTPLRYCGEYQDLCSGLIYLRNRYYNPSIGRFITEDSARDGLNWYVYANNNPLKYIDPSGLRSKEAADKIIKDNATYIISAAEEFGVNPGILAATIYAEQRLNVDWKDDYIDGIVGFYGVDTSIGIGQLRISTAKFIEKEGYMPTLSAKDGGWNIPLIGFVHGTEQMVREKSLENSELNIKYAAGYLKYFQDEWKNVYLDIDGKTDILATLYNLGHEQTSPNSNPKPNDFGKFAKENYFYVRKLLGLE